MAATLSWTSIFLIALAITAVIVVYSRTVTPTGQTDLTLGNVVWTYVGVFTAISIIVGILEILLTGGYGTGDIF